MIYDLIVCGTGFASSFFLMRFRERFPLAKILVLERGPRDNHFDAVEARIPVGLDTTGTFAMAGLKEKDWLFTLGLGGASNCWWGQTPRMWPEDFQLRTLYDVGFDWPISYDDLAPYYTQAEAAMQIAGSEITPYPRNGPYPQIPHPLSDVDRAIQQLVGPEMWAASPTARSSEGTYSRGKCCANGVCGLCPVDAKFRVMNELASLYDDDPQLDLKLEAEVTEVIIEAGVARGVVWRDINGTQEARSDIVFLGANAMFNPAILLASGDDHPLTGRRLHEQASVKVTVDLNKLDDFNGGTHITGLGYMYYGGDQRRTRGSCLIEHYNAPAQIRTDAGKWQKRAVFKIVAENIPEDRNRVTISGNKPLATFEGHTDYALKALQEVPIEFLELLGKIDTVERVNVEPLSRSEGHIQGTTVMATDPNEGVVDADLRHHRIEGLLVGGSGVFPSGPPSNPSLTISALSLRAADRL